MDSDLEDLKNKVEELKLIKEMQLEKIEDLENQLKKVTEERDSYYSEYEKNNAYDELKNWREFLRNLKIYDEFIDCEGDMWRKVDNCMFSMVNDYVEDPEPFFIDSMIDYAPFTITKKG